MPDNANTEPTERSIPPIRMTKVMPTAMTPRTVTWSITLSRFLTVRNVSVLRDRKRQRRMRPISGPVAPRMKFKALAPVRASAVIPPVVIRRFLQILLSVTALGDRV